MMDAVAAPLMRTSQSVSSTTRETRLAGVGIYTHNQTTRAAALWGQSKRKTAGHTSHRGELGLSGTVTEHNMSTR